MASIRKRTWKTGDTVKTAWVVDYFDQHGKRHLKTFRQKKDADRWLVAARSEVQHGTHTAASNSITVEQAGEMWIAEAETDGLDRGTILQSSSISITTSCRSSDRQNSPTCRWPASKIFVAG